LHWKYNCCIPYCWWVTCHCQLYKNNKCCTIMLLWQICVAGSSKMYLGLNIKCLTFLSFFKQIRIFLTDFHKCAQYQSSQKSIQWESHWYVWTDGQTWQIYICFLLFMWMCLKTAKLSHQVTTFQLLTYHHNRSWTSTAINALMLMVWQGEHFSLDFVCSFWICN
jgi:hypothetical protein